MADFNPVVFDAAISSRGKGVEPLRAALAAHPDLLDAPNPNKDGRTPLHAAAYTGSVEAVQLLLDHGSQSLDAPDFKGQTPMHCAATETAAIVEALMRAGSQSLDIPDNKGSTPLHYAAKFGKVEALEALLRAGSQSLDTPDKYVSTPLNYAAANGQSAAVEALLRAGSQSLYTLDIFGRTPLHRAASKRHVGTVQALLRAGADPTIGISDEQRQKFIPAIQQLLANGPQPSSSSAARASAAPSRAEPSSVVVRPTAAAQQSGTDSPTMRSEVERLQAQLRAAREQLAGEQQARAAQEERLQAQLVDEQGRNRQLQEQLTDEQERNRQLQVDNSRLQGDNERLVERVEQLESEVRESRAATAVEQERCRQLQGDKERLENEVEESRTATAIVAVYRQWGADRTIFTKRSGEVPVFEAAGPKRGGTALGTMYEEVGTGRRWLGKVGNPSDDNVVGLTQRDTYRRLTKLSMNFDAIQEKLAYDLFEHLGDGRYRVPDSLMSEQPIIDRYTRTHPIALAWAADQQLAQEALGDRHLAPDERHRLSNESLRLMTEYIDGYSDFRAARCAADDDEQTPIDFVAYIERYHRPPDHLLAPDGRRVPLGGLMELLAVGRLLADVDLIGGGGMNAGFVWTQSPDDQRIDGALTVKIDPGMSFKFGDDSGMNWVRNTRYALHNRGFRCDDARDLQPAAQNTAAVIHWAALSAQQRRSFLQALAAAQRKLQHSDVMEFLLYRHGRYNRSTMEMVPYPTIARWTHDFRQWSALQAELYADDMALL